MTDAPLSPARAAAIAHSERRRQRLEELSEIGMTMARELQGRVLHGDRLHVEVAPMYVPLSRAVRLSIHFEQQLEERILALIEGGPPAGRQVLPAPAVSPFVDVAAQAFAFTPGVAEAYHARTRAQVDAAVEAASAAGRALREAAERGESECLDETHGDLAEHESLAEREVGDRFAFVSFEDAVEAICKDLGIDARARFLGEGAIEAPAWTAQESASAQPSPDGGDGSRLDAGAPEVAGPLRSQSQTHAATPAPSRLHATIPALE